jgi:gamma-glutamylcyclotransferase (GGCT)/AIG2-like uncharacterized protein YtfP
MRASTIRHVFVYGTLKRGQQNEMAVRLATEGRYCGKAHLAGRLVDLGSYPGLLPALSGAERVSGELFALPESSDLLECLDRYEGCHADDAEPHEYCRIVCTATDEDGVRVWCWAYLYQWPTGEGKLLPDGEWPPG